MEDPSRTDSFTFATCPRYVVNLTDLNGFHVAVFSQTSWSRCYITPPVRCRALDEHLFCGDNEVRFAQLPADVIRELKWLGQVCRVAFRSSVTGPRRDCRDLSVAERRVVFEVLNTNVLLNIPGRHGTHAVTDPCATRHPRSVRSDLIVGDQRHWSTAIGVMTLLAAPL